MYRKFYGFTEKPFNVTPDPDFLYLTKKHEEALSNLIYGIESQKGFVVLTGEIGTGKTTVIRALMRQIGADIEFALIFNPRLSFLELLREIVTDLNISFSPTDEKSQLIRILNEFALKHVSQGKNIVIIIDEAQNLEKNVLEELRLLTNLETEKEKLIQIFLVGQPDLADKIDSPELYQLKQRIGLRFHLTALADDEVEAYVYHRLSVANPQHKIIFSEGAVKLLCRYSRGIPRIINVICDNALIHAFADNTFTVSEKMIESVASDFKMKEKPVVTRYRYVLAAVELMILILLFPGLYRVYFGFNSLNSENSVRILRDRDQKIFIPPAEEKTGQSFTAVDTGVSAAIQKAAEKYLSSDELKADTEFVHFRKKVSETEPNHTESVSENTVTVKYNGNYCFFKPSRLQPGIHYIAFDCFSEASAITGLMHTGEKITFSRINGKMGAYMNLNGIDDGKYSVVFEIISEIRKQERVWFFVDKTPPYLVSDPEEYTVMAGEKIEISARASADTGLLNAYFENQKISLHYNSEIRKCIGTLIVPMLKPAEYPLIFRATDFAGNSSEYRSKITVISL